MFDNLLFWIEKYVEYIEILCTVIDDVDSDGDTEHIIEEYLRGIILI